MAQYNGGFGPRAHADMSAYDPTMEERDMANLGEGACPTVRIVSTDTDEGYITINESEYDPKTMKRSDGQPSSDDLTVKDLRKVLGDLAIAIPAGASKADMLTLLEKAKV